MPASPDTQSEPEGSTTRYEWMDALRGLAIVLVILRHALTVPAEFGIDAPLWFHHVQEFLVPFRMPSLLLLSGLLLDRSLSKGTGRYISGKLRSLVWPYLIWAFVFLGLNDGGDRWLDPTAWIATSYLWFLFFLIVYYAAALVLTRLPAWLVVAAAWGASLLLPDGHLLEQMLYFAGWFFLGQLATRHWGRVHLLMRPVPAVIFAVLGALFGWFGLDGPPELEYRAEFALGALMGIIALAALFRALPSASTVLLQRIGRTSLIWYAAHVPILLVVRRVLVLAGVESFWAHWVLGSAAALAGSWVLVRLALRGAPFSWLFWAPQLSGGRMRGTPSPALRSEQGRPYRP